MPLPFNKSLDIKLIHLVKDNQILYNPRHPKYLDFDTREVVWQKIGDQLSRPGKLETFERILFILDTMTAFSNHTIVNSNLVLYFNTL